jgi:FixJ family two-component response regulator
MEMGLCRVNKWRVPPIHQITKDRGTDPTREAYTRMSDAERAELDKVVGPLVKRGFTTGEIARKLGVHQRIVDRSRARLKYAAQKWGGR